MEATQTFRLIGEIDIEATKLMARMLPVCENNRVLMDFDERRLPNSFNAESSRRMVVNTAKKSDKGRNGRGGVDDGSKSSTVVHNILGQVEMLSGIQTTVPLAETSNESDLVLANYDGDRFC